MARKGGNEFEGAFQKLEGIVAKLENEEISLDESLRLFEEGVGLSRFCHAKLEEIEKKIETIVADSKGNPKTAPFHAEDDDADEDADDEDEGEDDGKVPF
ncbi:MAG: exodeoxyribonuclease VII small subunit [Thermoanaerobaculia bacterium]|jgi:exodeoxyribonuclease VII small subunit